MCKELWIEAYEAKIGEIMQLHDMDFDEADDLLKEVLNSDPCYLDGNVFDLIEHYAAYGGR